MEVASDKLEFERAASMRDKLQRLEALKQQFLRFRFAVETLSFIYTVPGYGGEDRVYLIRRGRVRAEDIPPQAERDHRRLAHLTEAVYGTVERETTQIPTHEIDELLLLSSWFRRFPGELARTVRAHGCRTRAGDPSRRACAREEERSRPCSPTSAPRSAPSSAARVRGSSLSATPNGSTISIRAGTFTPSNSAGTKRICATERIAAST